MSFAGSIGRSFGRAISPRRLPHVSRESGVPVVSPPDMSRPARPMRFGIALAALPLVVACASGASAGSPEATLSAYSRAIAHGQLAEAYALLSDDAKKSIPFEQFKRMIAEHPEQAQE